MFTTLDFLAIGIYVIAVAVVGILASKKVKNAKDFSTSSRGLGMIVMIGSLGGAAIGSTSTLGLASDAMKFGVGAYWAIIGWNVGWIILALMAKRIYATGATGISDIFGKKFGTKSKLFASIVCLAFSVPALATQTIGLSNMFHTLSSALNLNIDYTLLTILLSILMIAMVFKGGLYSSAYTGSLNFFVLVVVFVVLLPIFTFSYTGGVGPALDNLSLLPSTHTGWFTGVGFSAVLGMIVKYCFTASTNIAYIGNTLAAKTERVATKSHWGGIASFFIVPGITLISTLILIPVLNTSIANPESTLPTIFLTIFPTMLRGVAISALIAVVFSTATIWVQQVKVSRVATVVWSAVAVAGALYVPQVMSMFSFTTTLYGSSMFFPLVATLFWKGTTSKGVNSGMAVGGITSLICLATGISGSIDPVIVGSLCNGVTVFVVSKLTQKNENEIAA